MRIVQVEIENFRGIQSFVTWNPAPGVNCLIGPGDSTKTTILDAIELCLNPRSYFLAEDCDFYNIEIKNRIRIIVTLVGLPEQFKAEDKYGLFLRGWNEKTAHLEDESGSGLVDALSVSVEIDESLEGRWSIFNNRIAASGDDPPTLRYKDSLQLATNRLGPYADRHFSWGRASILPRIAETEGKFSMQLAEARRAARSAFRKGDQSPFKKTAERAEALSKQFSVPVRDEYRAELDLDGAGISSGGIALHDGQLPLRTLGAGSSRLIVAALQHGAGLSHISLIDEVEHGLEPHRIARLLKYLKTPEGTGLPQPQVFLTTHSPIVVMELSAKEVFAVRSTNGETTVHSIETKAKDPDTAQKHLRSAPEAFLARRIVVGEGRTEQGLVRGLDDWWSSIGKNSLALQGAVVVDGCGKDKAPIICEHLLDLGHRVFLLHDTDQAPNEEFLRQVRSKGGQIGAWPDMCSIEQRIFLDLPWASVCSLLKYAMESESPDNVLAHIQNACEALGGDKITCLDMCALSESPSLRQILGRAAKFGKWFKDISRGEHLGRTIGPCLAKIPSTPLAKTLAQLRKWIDAEL